MAKYPDIRSAAIPALHIVQREHGWCSPEAIEQAACVMRLTPAYLTAVATFYDMFSTTPKGSHDVYVCTNISCSLRGADAIYDAMLSAAGDDPDFHVTSFECLGACDIAPMASVDGEYVGPLEEADCARIVDGRQGRPRGAARQAAARSARSPSSTGGSPDGDPLQGDRRPRAGHARRLLAARRLRDAAQGALDGPAGRAAGDARLGRPRPRRRRLRDGQEDVLHPQGGDGQVPRLQRRRVRARHLQGPRADAEEPASAHRGDDHRRLRDRRQQVVHLHPRRVLAPGRRARRRGRRGARGGLPRREHPRLRRTRSTSSSTAAPAPTSAARRPRCSTRWRAAAATRA